MIRAVTIFPASILPGQQPPVLEAPACVHDQGSWCERVYRLTETDFLARYADTIVDATLRILLIVVVAVLVRRLLHRAIKRITRGAGDGKMPAILQPLRERGPNGQRAPGPLLSERRAQRARTIGSVLRSVTTFGVYAVAFTLVLGELGINLGPIIASAGIVGVALGFGAQNLVRDFLSGIFMMLEDQYGVGDTVDLGEAAGDVEAVGLRVTTLRDVNGTVWYVRNGEVLRVGNMSQGHATAVVDLPLAHVADVTEAIELATEMAGRLTGEGSELAADVLEPPTMVGVQSVTADTVTVRLTVKTRPGRQWAVQRALLLAILRAYDEAGIPPPYPTGRPIPPTPTPPA